MRFVLILLLCLFIAPPTAHAQVVISEVHWAGSDISSADEWLEIVNISDTTIELEGWTVTHQDSQGNEEVMFTFSPGWSLPPHQYLLMSNYPEEESVLSVMPDIVTTAVSLRNSQLLLRIRNSSGALVDEVDDGSGTPFSGGKDPYRSMERIDLFASGILKDNWRDAEDTLGFDDGVVVYGTPTTSSKEVISSTSSSITSKHFSSASSTQNTSQSSSSDALPSIVITEVLANPSGNEDYEWIEIANLGKEDVNIAGYILSDSSREHIIASRNSSGYLLLPQEHAVFFRYQTGLSLSNAGERLKLHTDDGTEIDSFSYQETGTDISFGREEDGSSSAFCVPTPREHNREIALQPRIVVQSGRTTDYHKATVNLNAELTEGTLTKAKCFWDFHDGTSSEKCNPPSHSWDYYGEYPVELRIRSYCGDESVRNIQISVLQERVGEHWQERDSSQSTDVYHPTNSSVGFTQEVKHSLVSNTRKSSAMSQSLLQKSSHSQSMSSSSSSAKYEQYNSSSYYSTNRAIVQYRDIPIVYTNVPENGLYSSSSMPMPEWITRYVDKSKEGTVSTNTDANIALPWMLLFGQSVIWVVVAGKRLI